MRKTRHIGHIGHGITFALIVGVIPIRAAIVNVDAINSAYYPSDRRASGGVSKSIIIPLGTEMVDNTEVDISGNIDADITTDPAVDRNRGTETQNQGLCDKENNPVQSDSLKEYDTLEDSVLIEICAALKREKIENSYLKKPKFASSLQAMIAQEQLINYYAYNNFSGKSAKSAKSVEHEHSNITKLGFGYSAGIKRGGVSNSNVMIATVLIPPVVLILAIGMYELIFGRRRKSR